MFLGIEVKAERLLKELDNGVLLCQLIDVLQSMVKTGNAEEPGVSRYLTPSYMQCICVHFLWSLQGCELPPQLFVRPWMILLNLFKNQEKSSYS